MRSIIFMPKLKPNKLRFIKYVSIFVALNISQSFGQGAVYPLINEFCSSTPSFGLSWSGVGAVNRWEVYNGSGWTNIASTSTSITVTTPTPGNYRYRVYADLGGGNFQYSTESSVSIYAPSQAGAGVAVFSDATSKCASDNAGTITLGSGTTGNVIGWSSSANLSGPWSEITNASSTLNISNVATTTYYKAIVQNGVCPTILSTNYALIDVLANPLGGTASAVASSICQSSSTLLSATGQSGTSFDWQLDISGTWTDQASGSTYSVPISLTPATYNYRLKASRSCKDATNAIVSKTAFSNVVSVLVSATTAATNPSGNNVVAASDPTINSITASPVNGSILRWELSTDNTQWTPLSANGTTYNYNNLTQSTFYRVITKNGACVEAASTSSVKITVAKGGIVSASTTDFCSPSSASSLTLSGHEGTSWVWESSVSPFVSWTPIVANVTTNPFSGLTQTTKYRVNINSGKAYSNELTITVSSPSIAGSLSTTNATVCPADATNRTINLTGNTGSVVRWESSTTNGDPWTAINNTTSSLTFNNLAESVYFRAVVKSGACTQVITSSLKIDVAQGGQAIGNTNLCVFDANVRSVSLQNSNGTVLNWERSEFNTGTGLWSAFTNIGNGGSLFLTYSNLTKSTRYRAVIQSACASPVNSSYAEITINDVSVGGTLSGNRTVRPGANSSSINLVGNNGTVIRWESSPTNTNPWQTINNATTTLNYSNITETTYYRAIVQNGTCAEIASSNTILITVANGGQTSGISEICQSVATTNTITLSNHVGTISRWQSTTNNGTTWNNIASTAGLTSVNFSNLTLTTGYRAVITEDGGDMFSTAKYVIVNPLPVPNYTFTTACLNAATSFSNTSSISTGSILSYVWNYGDNSGSSIANPSHTFANANTYSVKLIATSDKLCKDSTTKSVLVRPLPSVDFTFNNVCDQLPVSFTNNSSISGYTMTYAWGFGDTFTDNVSDPSHTYPSKGTYNATLTVFANGTCAKSITKQVTIYEKPVANFTQTNVCDANAMQFTNSSYISNGNLTYAWTFNDAGATSTLENPSRVFTNANIFNVQLVATSAYNCTHSVTKVVQIYPNPVPNFNVSNNCFGQSTVFTNASTIATGSMLYAWDFKDGSTSTSLNPTKTYNATGSYYTKLTVTSDRGCVKNIEKEVIIYQKPNASFLYNDICAKDTVSFINLSTHYGGTMTHQWNFADASPISAVFSPKKVYTTYGNYLVTLTVTSNNGCTDVTSRNIVVSANPVASFTNSAATCFGQSTSFTSTATIPAGTINTRSWDFGDGQTSNLTNPNHGYTQDGVYRVYLTVLSAKGCKDTVSKVITISQKPKALFSQNDVCKTAAMSFVNASSNTVALTSYQWDFGDASGVSTQQSPSYQYANPGTYTVSLTVLNPNSCSDVYTKQVQVYPNPIADFIKRDTCEGNLFQFTNLSTISGGTMSYLWNFANGTTSSNADPAIVYAGSGTYNVSLVVSSDKGCQSTKTLAVNSYPNPIVLFSAQDVCYSFNTVFVNNSQIQSGTMAYTWDLGDQSTSTSTNPIRAYNSPGTYFVRLNVVSNKGCKGTNAKFIEVYPKPNADFTFNELCEGLAVNFSNISAIESGTMTYAWKLGNSQISNNTNPSTTYNISGVYNVELIAVSNRNCLDTTNKNITVYPLPVVGFSNDTVCDGVPTTFRNTSSIVAGNTIVYYQWDFGDLTNSLQQDPIHQFLNGGNYNVSLLAESDKGCKKTLTKTVAVNNVPVANFSAAATCLRISTEFINRTVIAAGSTGVITYQWKLDDGNTNTVKDPLHIYDKPGTYLVTLKSTISGGQCTDSITKAVVVNPLPRVTLPKDTAASKGSPLAITASVSEGTYTWTPTAGLDNPLSATVIAKPTQSTDYIFTVTDNLGCKNSDTIKVSIRNDYELVGIGNTIANIVVPNGNGKNKYWVIENITSYPDNTVYIYNRWGQEVFKAKNYQNDWGAVSEKGDQLPDGSYYYVVTFDSSPIVHKGVISILQNAESTVILK